MLQMQRNGEVNNVFLNLLNPPKKEYDLESSSDDEKKQKKYYDDVMANRSDRTP